MYYIILVGGIMPIEKIQEPGFDQKIKTQVVVKQSNMNRLRASARKDNRSTSRST